MFCFILTFFNPEAVRYGPSRHISKEAFELMSHCTRGHCPATVPKSHRYLLGAWITF